MTRKDYELIAKTLKKNKPSLSHEYIEKVLWENIVKEFASSLKQENQRFNEAIFLEACRG